MSTYKRIGIGILVSMFAMGGLTACSSSDNEVREDESVVERETEEAAEESAEAAEVAAEAAARETEEAAEATGEYAEEGVQQTEEAAKDIGEGAGLAQERTEKEIEEFVGGGPVESDTVSKIEEVEREMANYEKAIKKKGAKLDTATRLQMKSVEERISLIKKQYNEYSQQAKWGVAEIDAELEDQAENIKDDWEDVEDNLEDMLDDSYEYGVD